MSNNEGPEWDIFISYASEDKELMVQPLAARLVQLGLRVWFDKFELSAGDSLSRSIDKGLASSRFGAVVLSPAFLTKPWTEYELRGLVAREIGRHKVIIPIWYGITRDDVLSFSPPLADKISLDSTKLSIDELADALLEIVDPGAFRTLTRTNEWRRAMNLAPRLQGRRHSAQREPTTILKPELITRIRIIFRVFESILPYAWGETLDNFRRDVDPEREVEVWERMAATMLAFRRRYSLTIAQEIELYGRLLARSLDRDPKRIVEGNDRAFEEMLSGEYERKYTGSADNAVELLETQISLLRAQPEPNRTTRIVLVERLHQLHRLYLERQEGIRAVSTIKESISILEEIADESSTWALANSYHALAKTLHSIEYHEEALEAFRTASQLFGRIYTDDNHRYDEYLEALHGLARLLGATGNLVEAIDAATQAVNIARQVKSDERPIGKLVQGLSIRGQLNVHGGVVEEAISDLNEAYGIYKGYILTDGFWTGVPALHDLARSLSEAYTAQGDNDRVLRIESDVVEFMRTASSKEPRLRGSLALCLAAFADQRLAAGDAQRASASSMESVSLARALIMENPRDYGVAFVQALDTASKAAALTGASEAAVTMGEQAVEFCREALSNSALDESILGQALGTLAAHQTNLSEGQSQALTYQQEAVGIFGRLSNIDPASHLPALVDALNNLAATQHDLGDQVGAIRSLDEAGDASLVIWGPAAAIRYYTVAAKLGAQLTTTEPSNASVQHELATTYYKIAEALTATGDATTATQLYGAGLAMLEQLAASEPDNDGCQYEIAIYHVKMGNLAETADDIVTATQRYRAALLVRERLAKTCPENIDYQHELAASHSHLGDVAASEDDWMVANQHHKTALSISTQIAAEDPGNAIFQRELGVCHEKLGTVAVKTANAEAASEHFQAAFTIREGLARANPDDILHQRDLSVSHYNLGDLASAAGRTAAALSHFQSDLAIAERIANAQPNNVGYQRDLGVSHNRVGNAAEAVNDKFAANKHFLAALAISERLATLSPTNPSYQNDLAVSRRNVARSTAALEDTGPVR